MGGHSALRSQCCQHRHQRPGILAKPAPVEKAWGLLTTLSLCAAAGTSHQCHQIKLLWPRASVEPSPFYCFSTSCSWGLGVQPHGTRPMLRPWNSGSPSSTPALPRSPLGLLPEPRQLSRVRGSRTGHTAQGAQLGQVGRTSARGRSGVRAGGAALQDALVQHHRAQQPAAEGTQEVPGSRGVTGLEDVHGS